MNDAGALLTIATVLAAAGIAVVFSAFAPRTDKVTPGAVLARLGGLRRLGGATLAGLIVLIVTGWPGPSLVIGGLVWWSLGLVLDRARRAGDHAERVDALAAWAENVRDVLTVGRLSSGVISATVQTADERIRPSVRRLAARLATQPASVAFRLFADDLDDPIGDLIASGLLVAFESGGRAADVLSALAGQARHQAERRRLVDAERAPAQREVTAVSIVMGAMLLAVLLFGRSDYLKAYRTVHGQVVLTGLLLGYGGMLRWVRRLTRTPRASRFLTLGRSS
jgi:tight adherence protein B